jgi:hypothetical protein
LRADRDRPRGEVDTAPREPERLGDPERGERAGRHNGSERVRQPGQQRLELGRGQVARLAQPAAAGAVVPVEVTDRVALEQPALDPEAEQPGEVVERAGDGRGREAGGAQAVNEPSDVREPDVRHRAMAELGENVRLEPLPIEGDSARRVAPARIAVPDSHFEMGEPVARELCDGQRRGG